MAAKGRSHPPPVFPWYDANRFLLSLGPENRQYRRNTRHDHNFANARRTGPGMLAVGIVMMESRVIEACNPAFASMFFRPLDELLDQVLCGANLRAGV